MALTLSLQALVNRLLDKTFKSTAGPMLAQIYTLSNFQASPMQLALRDLEEETQKLEQEGRVLAPHNSKLKEALRQVAIVFLATQALLQANSVSIEESGQVIAVPTVTAKVFQDITRRFMEAGADPLANFSKYKKLLDQAGAPWRIPNNIGMFAERFTSSEAWIKRMEGWGKGYADLISEAIEAGLENGWNPNYTAKIMRQFATTLPQSAAENIARTLQLTSYREASLAMEQLNGAFIIKKIRIASLDVRTCLSCIALHGTDLEPGQRVDDHYRGRCSEFYVVPGGPEYPAYMLADSPSGGRNVVKWQTGEEWFRSLPASRQKIQASFRKSPGKWNAYVAGNPLGSFVAEHFDDVFGRQIVENSILGAFGEEGTQYYVRNQGVTP